MTFWRSAAKARDALAQADAIGRSQAVIEFGMDGTILTANENFLDAMGYRLAEIAGKRHAMFVAARCPRQRRIPGVLGRSQSRQVQGGRVQARRQGRSRDLDSGLLQSDPGFRRQAGKVVKFATDITAQKIGSMEDAGKIAAIARAQAVIEFNLDGTVITANENFLNVLGYSLSEIKGKHHSMFVAPSERDSAAYREFWQGSQSWRIPQRGVQAHRQRRQGGLDPRLL